MNTTLDQLRAITEISPTSPEQERLKECPFCSCGEMARLLKEVTHHMTLTYRDEEWQWESIRLQERVTALLSQLESKGEV